MVVQIGDLIDSHYTSFHEIDPDGHSAGEELRLAKKNLKKWHDSFPNAIVTVGNHDRIHIRKAFNAGISKAWLKPVNEVLETPTWEYREHLVLDDVLYCHGEQRVAHTRMKDDQISVVQGHYHSGSKIVYLDGITRRLWSMQVGCGFDSKSYAAAYAKFGKMQSHNCGVVLENGRLPIIEPYDEK